MSPALGALLSRQRGGREERKKKKRAHRSQKAPGSRARKAGRSRRMPARMSRASCSGGQSCEVDEKKRALEAVCKEGWWSAPIHMCRTWDLQSNGNVVTDNETGLCTGWDGRLVVGM
jgi:hypothetical protein